MIAGASSEVWQRASSARAFSGDDVRAIEAFCAANPAMLRRPGELGSGLITLPPLRPMVEWIRSELTDGPGFATIGLGPLNLAHARLAFGLLGVMLAPPIDRYGFHYRVADTGQSHEEKAIPISMTRASTGLHTDSSAADCVPGIVGLLCERPSKEGGSSLIADAFAACRWIAENRPDVNEVLQRSFVRKIVTPGLDKSLESLGRNRFPILRWGPEFVFRYMRYWIVEGQKELGRPLDGEEVMALDILDETLMRPEFRVSFRLEAGNMLFVNNTHLVHGRTAYQEVPAGGRLLWRMWLDERHGVSRSPRPASYSSRSSPP